MPELPPSEPLSCDDVHIWLGDASAYADTAKRSRDLGLLTADETARMQRFHFERDRLLFLATRVLVRQTLSRYASTAPRDWRFIANAWGRPAIADANSDSADLQFNLSHADGLVAMAVTRGRRLGIDLEFPRGTDWLALARHSFAPAEVQAVGAASPDDMPRRFVDIWTLKESYVKAMGQGLSIPLDSFWFTLPPSTPQQHLAFSAPSDAAATAWSFCQWHSDRGHALALCLEHRPGEPARVRLRQADPLAAAGAVSWTWTRRSCPELEPHPPEP